MTRTAKQRATRRLKRQQMPTFPFTNFPAELQLMVLCKCDPQTAKRLLVASSYVQDLYVRYSETALPAIFAQVPAPVSALFQVSWGLQNDGFNWGLITDLLEVSDIFEWHCKLPAFRPLTSDPLEALQVLLDFYMEVDDAADLFGQCMVFGVEKFLDPTVQSSPVILSSTERTRIACALWVLKIFLQVQTSPHKPPGLDPRHSAHAFFENLQPWQIDHILSLESKLQVGEYPLNTLLFYAGPTDVYFSERLIGSQYVTNVFNRCTRPGGPCLFRVYCLHTARRSQYRRCGDGYYPGPSSMATQLRNHTWNSKELAQHTFSAFRSDRYRNRCQQLGLSFWDYERLAQWQIADAAELMVASDDADLRSLSFGPMCDGREHLTPPAAIARTMERQIIEWTRYSEYDTLEDYLYQKTLNSQPEQGEERFLRRFITPGAVCNICGLDGHWWYNCYLQQWRFNWG
ncbi:hypothetical protein C7974DRAFT_400829 [Boeremia exigua]|uniref:uncharacterized protein n=1 Tax=Boeremia exigua TaxID=749465 RepID=UPI001E8D7CF8|nr:uncharacterized protein C7974DRAFT_400829 [Boeremia exigua]KAH6618762.1 hypothetical protein C7974DRAFT_400829 [Boeremia exigua]